ncbi:MAG TPA: hypothetical protein EYP55_01970, partial [Anaerolineae bacterium]|nr:hypothetical protein [Anaerolineae bacterium]
MPPQKVTLPCPDCGQEFEAQIWTILDLGQEPDLARRFLAGEINVARCPGCGQAGFVAAPLAVHDPARERVIFFVPEVPGLDEAGRRAVISQLGNALLATLPPGQRPEYLFRPVVVSEPQALAEALTPQPEPGEGEEVKEALELIQQALAAEDPEVFVREHLDAFDETVLAVLAAAAEQVQADGEAEMAVALQALGALVVRLKLEAASPELVQAVKAFGALLACESREEVEALVAEHPELVLQGAGGAVEEMSRWATDPDVRRRLQAVAGWLQEVHPLLRALTEFIRAESWDESRRILNRHPELLGDEADALLAHLITAAQTQGDEKAVRILEEHRALLRRC